MREAVQRGEGTETAVQDSRKRGREHKRCKGVARVVVAKRMRVGDYAAVLVEGGMQTRVVPAIRSVGHEVFSIEQEKVALSSYDDKRWLLAGGMDSVPYGHVKTVL